MKTSKLKNGSYSARVYLGIVNGRRIQKRIVAPTLPELKKRIAEEKLRLKVQNDIPSPEIVVSVKDAFDSYIRRNQNIFSLSSIRGYVSDYNNIMKQYADKRITSITQKELQRYINENASNLNFKTIRNRVALFVRIISEYNREAKNWSFRYPPKTKFDIYVPTRDEVETLLAYAHEHFPRYELPIMLGAFCGLRRGEIGALTYSDIDFKNSQIRITKAMVTDAIGKIHQKSPKSYAGFRSVPLSPRIVQFIREKQKSSEKLISVTTTDISKRFHLIVEGAGLHPFRFHDLRHFFASNLVTLGVPDIYAIKLTGHSSTSMLQRVYQHRMSDAEKQYEETIRRAFT